MRAQSLRARFRETVAVAILEAAESVAAEVGLAEASLQAIAQRAGVAVGTIYNHFQDRQEVFTALFARRREELFDAVDAALETNARAAFEVQLDVFVRTVFAHFDARRAFLRIGLGADNLKSQVSATTKRTPLQELQARAERIMKVGMKEKRLRTEGSDLFALYLVATFRAVLIARVDSSKPFVDETKGVVKLFLHGAER